MDEFEVISNLFGPMSLAHKGALGLKDDIAFVDGAIFTTDTIVENVHFRSKDNFQTLGHKLVRVNVSDIICKGGLPDFALLNLSWPQSRANSDLLEFCEGLRQALLEFKLPLIGGDTTKSKGNLTISMTMKGHPICERPIFRHNANVGDIIFVTGYIGCALVGLEAWENDLDGYEYCKTHYQIPQIPKLDIAEIISSYANSSLDVSDGLIGDCTKLTSDNQIRINLENIPFHQETIDWVRAQPDELSAMIRLASFGDDYQCVFCVSPNNKEKVLIAADEVNIKLTEIGHITQNDNGGIFYGKQAVNSSISHSYKHEL